MELFRPYCSTCLTGYQTHVQEFHNHSFHHNRKAGQTYSTNLDPIKTEQVLTVTHE